MIWFMSDVFEPTVYGLQMSGLNSLPSRPWSAVIKVRLRGTALRSAGAPTGLAASAGLAAASGLVTSVGLAAAGAAGLAASAGFAASAGLAGSAGLAAGAAGAQAAMAALPASAAAVIRKRRRDAERAGVSIVRAPLFFESRGRWRAV